MFRGRWLITIDHWLMNLPSKNSHMDFTTRLCVVNFSIMQLTSDERMCFNASRVELNWLYWILILLVDLWISRVLWLLHFLSLFLNVTWHWVCLADDNITPSPNLRLDWVTIYWYLQPHPDVPWKYIVNVVFHPCVRYNNNNNIFFYLGFLSQPFTKHRTAGEEGGHFFNSSQPLQPASQTFRH